MKIIVHCDTGICGTESHDFYIVPDTWTENELQDFCWDCALQNAEMYGIYPPQDCGQEFEDEEFDEIEGDEYSDDISGWYEVYDSEKHDMYMVGGGDSPNFQDLTK